MSSFDCSICCQQCKITQCITCPNCGHEFCLTCQRTYGRDDCMNCRMKFTQRFMIQHLGKKFVETVIKPKIIEQLMAEQKEKLKSVQPLVDWEKTVREQKKQLRFGIHMTMPERPKISTLQTTQVVFPCPSQQCRGFIEQGVCGVCGINICIRCRETRTEGHVCKTEDLQSIALLMSDSKPCPRCCATIQKTIGCNHMYCTNCSTHFDWDTLRVLTSSSNGHYLHLQRFSQNVPVREVVGSTAVTCTETRGYSLYRHRVAIDEMDFEQLDQNLVQCLWNDSNAIRLIKRKKYNEIELEATVAATLQELQIRYLLGEITETQWSRQVYQQSNKQTLCLLYSDVLNIYLSTVDLLQQSLTQPLTREPINPQEHYSPNLSAQKTIKQQYQQLVELCNESFNSIQEEYGGPAHHIRSPNEELTAAPFL